MTERNDTMILINDPSDNTYITINGTNRLTEYIQTLCKGFWMYKTRPSAYEDWLKKTNVQSLSVYFDLTGDTLELITDKTEFHPENYNEVMRILEKYSDEYTMIYSQNVDIVRDHGHIRITFR
jgi:hypothetical protein